MLEDLTHIWQKGGKFGRGMRRRLYSAMMRNASNLIYEKSRFLGVEALLCVHTIHPRYVLHAEPHKDCTHCYIIGVDRYVNAVENIRRTSAVSRYGRQVSASLGKVHRSVDIILDPTSLIQGCWSNWADRLFRMVVV
ncbi:MAG: hypothetical protein F4X71_05465 [Cenarchaeum sp. SB0662_bin_33]|nr:hypothetical protein [Cenarchaeum sp. SB0662_bin_33]